MARSAALKIGQVAAATGVKIQTIRYYERRGLLPQPERSPSGYRYYAASVLDRLRFIRHARNLGFSLGQIEQLLALWSDTSSDRGEIQRQCRVAAATVGAKIAALQRLRWMLEELMSEGVAEAWDRAWPALEALTP